MASNGSKNGKTERDLLLQLMSDVRQLQKSQETMRQSQESIRQAQESMRVARDETNRALGSQIETTARMIGSIEALIGAAGEQDARIDDLNQRVGKRETRK